MIYRPNVNSLIERLKLIGGDIVVLEDYVKTDKFKRLISDLSPPKLGLNCIGGESSTLIARNLG